MNIVDPEILRIPILTLGDLTIVGDWPGKTLKALAVIADTLHSAYDVQPDAYPGGSKDACIFSSLAVRDFLVAIGYEDATVHSVGVVIQAVASGKVLHSLGIGMPGLPDVEGKFNGHVAVTVPSLKLMIDTTLYPSLDRDAWSGAALSGMMALPFYPPGPQKVHGYYPFAGIGMELPDRLVEMVWLDRPDNEKKWRRSRDYLIKSVRRKAVTRALIDRFGEWKD